MQYSGVKNIFSCSLLFVILFFFGTELAFAQNTLAFPGAEGFGKYSQGGRGGEVIKVTNLDDKGPGSLRAALEAEGPRIVIFEIGGLIDLETPIEITNPYITIAGQTAPGDGIAIRGNGLKIYTHDVIIRFMRIRSGDKSFGPENDWGNLDAISIGNYKHRVYNIIIDHCSISWAVDENIGLWHDPYNVTIQNSIVSEGLHNSKHPEDKPHSRGILVGNKADSISVLNNLMMHNTSRNPLINSNGLHDVRNNVIYNPLISGAAFANNDERQQEVNFVNNIFIRGPNTQFEREININKPEVYNAKLFLENNIGFSGATDNWEMIDEKSTREVLTEETYNSFKAENEFANADVSNRAYSEIQNFIDGRIGASLPVRDEVDKRLIEEFNNEEGSIINSQKDVGGWPIYLNNLSQVEDQGNGIPEGWMKEHDIQRGEENMDFDNDDYTNIEEYLNGTDPHDSSNSKNAIFRSSSVGSLHSLNFSLEQNYPNPFNSQTKIRMNLPNGYTKVMIYDSIGKKIKTLLDRNLSSGEYELTWNPEGELASGIYFLKIIHEGKSQNLPMTYLK